MFTKIITKIPHPRDLKDYKDLERFEARSMLGQLPIFWDKAEDFLVYDRHGNIFIDFTSTICVANIGHGNKWVVNAITKVINKPLLHTYTFPHEYRLSFLRILKSVLPKFCEKAFLVSAGTEATEVACKLMRMYSMKQKGKSCKVLISIKGAMHGRTMLTERLKGVSKDNQWAMAFDSDIYHISGGLLGESFEDDIKNLLMIRSPKDIAGFIIESYQGWSASFYPKEYIQELVKFAKQFKIPVCFDEIQGGFGRTGKKFAYEHYEVEPDLLCLGKALNPSVPLSAVTGRKKIMDVPEVGSMSSTHSANPLACASGIASLVEFSLLNRRKIENNSRILYNGLLDLGFEVRGHGMLYAIITKTEKQATDIVWKAFKKGLLTIWTHKNSIKIAPPLTTPVEAIEEGIDILKKCV